MAATHPIAAQLARIRHEQKASRELAAAQARMSARTIRNLEDGTSSPTLHTLTRYAAALGYQITLTPITNGASPQ